VPDNRVRPPVRRLTDSDARHLLADGLLRSCHAHGPARVALETGCDEKTIRRARDEETTLKLACAFNLLDIDPHALDALAAAKGVMLVPLIDAAPDFISAASATIHQLAEARSPDSPGGHLVTDCELLAMEAKADACLAAALELKSQIAAAKLRRAGGVVP
jgi:hypothetical protein